jgi:hypothetical protein
MSGPDDSLAASIAQADGQLSVLDDRVDVEDRVEYLWLRAHVLRGYANHRVAVGTDVLSAGWRARKKIFHDQSGARIYLHHFAHSHSAMHSLRTLAQTLNFVHSGLFSDSEAIDVVASGLVAGRAWLIELPARAPASRFVSKTSPSAFAPLNPRYGTKVDFAFIASLEGNQWLRGYVPMKNGIVLGKSGMTVASGFDLGQWDSKDLGKFGFPQQLMDKITPFASPNRFKGLNKKEVAAKVAKLGPVPVLTKEEADLCDGAVFGAILKSAATSWNSLKAAQTPKFTDLPAGWQTVWLSRFYQEGSSPKIADAIAFRKDALAGNWQLAIAKLRAYTNYKDRAKQEADLLAKELPPTTTPAPAKQVTRAVRLP